MLTEEISRIIQAILDVAKIAEMQGRQDLKKEFTLIAARMNAVNRMEEK